MRLNIIKNAKRKEKKSDIKPSQNNTNLLNYTNLKNLLGNSEDIKYRDIVLNENKDMTIHLVFIDGLVNSGDVSNYVVRPLIENEKIKEAQSIDEVIKLMQEGIIYFVNQSTTDQIEKLSSEIISGRMCYCI